MPIAVVGIKQFINLSAPALLIGIVLLTLTTTVSEDVQPFEVSIVFTIKVVVADGVAVGLEIVLLLKSAVGVQL